MMATPHPQIRRAGPTSPRTRHRDRNFFEELPERLQTKRRHGLSVRRPSLRMTVRVRARVRVPVPPTRLKTMGATQARYKAMLRLANLSMPRGSAHRSMESILRRSEES